VIERKIGWLASRFAAMSTALKMLLILSFGLFPLGLIAILASIQSARDNSAEQRSEISARAQLKAQRLNSAISRLILTTEAASTVIGLTGGDPEACDAALHRFKQDQPLIGRYAFFAEGNVLACATPGFKPPPPSLPRPTAGPWWRSTSAAGRFVTPVSTGKANWKAIGKCRATFSRGSSNFQGRASLTISSFEAASAASPCSTAFRAER
jgi:hypothetical protein